MTRDEAVQLFDRRRRAWLAEDVEGYLALFHDDLVIDVPGRPTMRGIDAYAELVRRSNEYVKPVSFDFHEIAVDGATVLSEWTITIERRDGGRRITYDGMSRCEIRDDVITSWREYYDPAQLRPA